MSPVLIWITAALMVVRLLLDGCVAAVVLVERLLVFSFSAAALMIETLLLGRLCYSTAVC